MDVSINFYFNFSNLEEYSVGSEERLELNLEIHNAGEDAYEATFYLAIPESVNYVKTEVIGGEVASSSVPVLCSPPTMNNDYMLKCDLGNPMDADSKVQFQFNPYKVTSCLSVC